MAVEIAWDPKQQVAVMWDNTSDTAFGPVFSGPSADTEAAEFLEWLRTDARIVEPSELIRLAGVWGELPTVQNVNLDAVRVLEEYGKGDAA